MQESALRAFCDVFAELPQRVLWKWETMDMPGKPQNVKIVQWAPQRDILGKCVNCTLLLLFYIIIRHYYFCLKEICLCP